MPRPRSLDWSLPGSRFVYVFDRSGSMGEHKNLCSAAKEQLLASLADLNPQQQFYIIFYNHEPKLFDPVLARTDWYSPATRTKSVRNNLYPALTPTGAPTTWRPCKLRFDCTLDVIFLLTDGEAVDDLSADDLKRLERLNSGEASINVIQFAAAPRPESSLIKLAEQNRGKHIFIDVAKLGEHAAAN